MSPALNAWLSLIFIIAGAVSLFTMLELRGRPKLTLNSKTLIMIHRISGYIFVLIYLLLIVFMVMKLKNYQLELSPRANIHILLAVALFPILAIKLLIARIYKKLSGELLFLGVTLFTLGFSLNVITSGYYLMRNFSGRYISPTGAHSLTDTKCSRCHTLERAYSGARTHEGWESIVKRMRSLDESWILESDVPQIVDYLVQIRGVRAAEATTEIGKSTFEDKCGKCHPLDRPLSTSKTKEQWQETVKRMQGYDVDWLTDEDVATVVEYLSQIRGLE